MQARELFRHLRREVAADNIDDVAAMMTYYAVFALFPMLIFVVTVGLLVVPPAWIDDGLAMAGSAMPGDAASLLTDQVKRLEADAGAGFAIGSALLALWGASRGMSALMFALNDMFEKQEKRPWWKRQLIAIGTTLVIAVLLLVAISLLAAGPAVGDALDARFGLGAAFEVAWSVGRWLIAALLVMVTWAILFHWLPDTDAPFRVFTPGAAAGVLLWAGVTQAFGFYLDRFASYEQTYGTIASAIVFLMWLWLSNLALLIGAEINDVIAEVRKEESPAAAELAEDETAGRAQPPAGVAAAMRSNT